MPRRAVRKNARRTWPDGSGCDQRPLFPHEPGCPGWIWHGTESAGPNAVVVTRCKKCRTFDDDADAADHVRGCRACRDEIASTWEAARKPRRGRAQYAPRYVQGDPEHRPLPDSRARKLLCDFFFDTLSGSGSWDIESLPDPSDSAARIEVFLYRVGAGVYDFQGDDGAGYESPKAAAWWTLRDWAAEDFTEYMEDQPFASTRDWAQ